MPNLVAISNIYTPAMLNSLRLIDALVAAVRTLPSNGWHYCLSDFFRGRRLANDRDAIAISAINQEIPLVPLDEKQPKFP
jgi:hypothetical protein